MNDPSGSFPARCSSPVVEGIERRLARWHATVKGTWARLAFRALPHLAGVALEMDAAALHPGPLPRFFSTTVREIGPALNDDLLELYGRAGQALENRFAFFNSPQAFDREIDWEPPQTPSWRAELHAGDYILDLACTYRISREEVYARHIRYLMAHWIVANPPISGTGWLPYVLARRLRNWMLSSDLARSDWENDPEFWGVVTKSLTLQTAFLLSRREELPSPAARLDASRALLCASRFFQGKARAELRSRGLELLVPKEEAPSAGPWPSLRLARAQALMEWNLFSESSEDADFLEAELEAALAQLEAALLPNGSLPLFGPEARLAQDELADLAALAAVRFQSSTWKSLAGKFGILPYLLLGEPGKDRYQNLPETPWTPQDNFDAAAGDPRLAGPENSAMVITTHFPSSRDDHQDFLSYELVIQGHRVVVDSGGFAPEETAYFPRAQAHNILLVDGYAPRWGNSECPAASAGGFHDLTPGCARLQMPDPGFRFLGLHHERAWFRLENGAWAILDRLEGEGSHRSTSLVHFYPTLEIVRGEDRALVHSRALRFAVIPLGDSQPLASVSRGDHAEFPGYYSPEFGVKFPASVLAWRWERCTLPWLGGMLILSGCGEDFRRQELQPQNHLVRVEFSGKVYDLRMH
jgi:hypothetical protein